MGTEESTRIINDYYNKLLVKKLERLLVQALNEEIDITSASTNIMMFYGLARSVTFHDGITKCTLEWIEEPEDIKNENTNTI